MYNQKDCVLQVRCYSSLHIFSIPQNYNQFNSVKLNQYNFLLKDIINLKIIIDQLKMKQGKVHSTMHNYVNACIDDELETC